MNQTGPMTHYIYTKVLFTLLYIVSWKKNIFLANRLHLGTMHASYKETLYNMCSELVNLVTTKPFPVLENHTLESLPNKAILLTAHIGNHEYLAKYLLNNQINLRAFYQKLNSKFFNRFLERRRIHKGVNYAPYNADTWRTLIKDFSNEEFWFAYLWDQDPNYHPRIAGTFFNQEIYSHQFMETFFHRFPDTPVYFATFIKNPSGTYQLHLVKKESDEDLHHFYLRNLESEVSKTPNQWFGFFHKRFKSANHSIYTSMFHVKH